VSTGTADEADEEKKRFEAIENLTYYSGSQPFFASVLDTCVLALFIAQERLQFSRTFHQGFMELSVIYGTL